MSLGISISAPLAGALAATLAHFVWEGAALALLLSLALRCAGRKAATRYVLACLTMGAMMVAFGISLAYFWPVNSAGSAVALPFSPTARVTPGPGPGPAGPAASLAERLAWVVPFWIAGVFSFYLYGLGGWVVAQRLRRRGVAPAPDAWQERLHRLRHSLRLSRPVALMESCLAEVPVVIGLVRPVILLPVGLLTGLSVDQVEAILIHELAHVGRGDYLINALQKFVEGLLFYHPAVWWVSGLIRAERENCCDDVVVQLSGDAHGYASTLAALEGIRWPAREPVLAATGGDLMRRVRRLLHQSEGPRAGAAPAIVSAILLGTAALLSAWQPAPPAPRPQQAAEPETPYVKWLKEDAAYIITDQERAAFQRLQTDEEREHFIEQFWLRRDPTPGTVENEFKEEHYRRIAYTNQNYSNAYLAGWKTDRGRIYITYGPPDEKESHPSGGRYARPAEQGGGVTTTFPFESWLYHYIKGIGENVIVEFVDPTMTGEYRMTTDPSEKDAQRYVAGAPAAAGPAASKEWRFVDVRYDRASGSGIVTVDVPLYIAGEERPLKVQGRITNSAGSVLVFEEDGLQGREYRKSVTLAPGAYLVEATISGKNGRFLNVGPKAFEVK